MKILSSNVIYKVSRCFHNSCRRCQKSSQKFIKKKKMSDNGEGSNSALEGVQIGDVTVWPWSISGIESTITVKGQGFNLAFDMGYATPESVSCKHVFISHGHMDHVAGIVHHAAKRSLFSMKPAIYFCPEHLVENLQNIARYYSNMTTNDMGEFKVQGVKPGDTIPINSHTYVCPFKTFHRVPSQGYIVYAKKRTLKPEFVGKDNLVIREAIGSGQQVHNEIHSPLIAYTGDTMIEVFKDPPIHDLLQVQLLITEATYIDNENKHGKTAIDRARSYGHIHLQEIVDNYDAFKNVGNILLVHFSNKYSVPNISETVKKAFKDHPDLYNKIYLGSHLKLLQK